VSAEPVDLLGNVHPVREYRDFLRKPLRIHVVCARKVADGFPQSGPMLGKPNGRPLRNTIHTRCNEIYSFLHLTKEAATFVASHSPQRGHCLVDNRQQLINRAVFGVVRQSINHVR